MDKCTRCGRQLKKSFLIEGKPYGPICVVKMGGTVTVEYTGGRPTRKHKEIVVVTEQQDFFAVDMAEIENRVYADAVRRTHTVLAAQMPASSYLQQARYAEEWSQQIAVLVVKHGATMIHDEIMFDSPEQADAFNRDLAEWVSSK